MCPMAKAMVSTVRPKAKPSTRPTGAERRRAAALGRGHPPPGLPFPDSCFSRLEAWKNKNREKGGNHFGPFTQGGAPLALGYNHAVLTGLASARSLHSRRGHGTEPSANPPNEA
jgi:hypothetical protein